MKPRWVDLQINGRIGISFTDAALTEEAVLKVTEMLAAGGTAGYQPTICTCPDEVAIHCLKTIAAAKRKYPECAKRILGIHMEGPFISPVDGYRGAHRPDCVVPPSYETFARWQEACGGLIRLVTIAAEVPGAADFTRQVTADGVAVSLGHMAAAAPEEIAPLAAAGAKAFTHLGNGIPNSVDRHRNVIFTALAEDRMTVMFIPDGFHLPKQVLRTYVRAVPLARLLAVSDCSYPGGLPPGTYERNGSVSVLEPSGFLRCGGTNLLHGSSCLLADAVKVLQSPEVGLTETECLTVARENPLRLIGMEGWED